MSTIMDRCYIIPPLTKHEFTIIFLHGRGSSAQDFAEELFECEITNSASPSHHNENASLRHCFPACKWVFPAAKLIYSETFREEMSQWFDLESLSDPALSEDKQTDGLRESVVFLQDIIEQEANIIGVQKIVLGGISQGYAIAAIALMVLNIRCAGFIGLSGWMPLAEQIKKAVAAGIDEEAKAASQTVRAVLGIGEALVVEDDKAHWNATPVFLAHEEHDAVVEFEHGILALEVFKMCKARPEWRTYDSNNHWIQEPDEINDIAAFLKKTISISEVS